MNPLYNLSVNFEIFVIERLKYLPFTSIVDIKVLYEANNDSLNQTLKRKSLKTLHLLILFYLYVCRSIKNVVL